MLYQFAGDSEEKFMSPKADPKEQREERFAKRVTLLTVLLICALAAACSKDTNKNQTNNNSQAQASTNNSASPAAPPSGLQASAPTEDKGDFKLSYVPVKNQELEHIEKLIKDSKLIEKLIDDSNKRLSLPVDIPVVFRECDGQGEDPTNAWYQPKDNTITMCYGLIKKTEDLFKNNEKTEKDLEEAVLGSTAWTFYHEMGHALIDIYKIAHTGKEEDAADELSTYVLINESGDEGEKAALNGAEDFYREADQDNDLNEEQFADSHSLSKQRFYNIICWVYGSNTEKYANLAEGDKAILPQGRAGWCADEYQRITKAWQNLLKPYTKK
jgi:hypothetical protein